MLFAVTGFNLYHRIRLTVQISSEGRSIMMSFETKQRLHFFYKIDDFSFYPKTMINETYRILRAEETLRD